MPSVVGVDHFRRDTFQVGSPYQAVNGTPARELSIVRPGDPASLVLAAAAATEYLQYPNVPGAPTRLWHAFAWRIDSNPAGDVGVAYLYPAAGAVGRLSYTPGSGALYHFVGGSGTQSIAYTLGTWAWVEQILNVSVDPRILNTRVNGVDLTDVSVAGAASTGLSTEIGFESAATVTMYYSHYLWGFAANDTDWLGESAAKEFLPGRNELIEQILASTVSKTVTIPWELVGASAQNVLGQVASTASVPVVWQSSTNPNANSDSSAGYGVGDLWLNTITLDMFWCVSSAVGSAIWKQVSV